MNSKLQKPSNAQLIPKLLGYGLVNNSDTGPKCVAILESEINSKNILNKLKFINKDNLSYIKNNREKPVEEKLRDFKETPKKSGGIKYFFKSLNNEQIQIVKEIFKRKRIISTNRRVAIELIKRGRQYSTEGLKLNAQKRSLHHKIGDAIIVTRVKEATKETRNKIGLRLEPFVTEPTTPEEPKNDYNQFGIFYLELDKDTVLVYDAEIDCFDRDDFSPIEIKNYHSDEENPFKEDHELQNIFGQSSSVVVHTKNLGGSIVWDDYKKLKSTRASSLDEGDFDVLKEFANQLLNPNGLVFPFIPKAGPNAIEWTPLLVHSYEQLRQKIYLQIDDNEKRRPRKQLSQKDIQMLTPDIPKPPTLSYSNALKGNDSKSGEFGTPVTGKKKTPSDTNTRATT